MLPTIPLKDIQLTDDQISSLLVQMNSLVNEFHRTDPFSKFPPGSWQISYRIKGNILFVNIIINQALLIKDFCGMMSDVIIWIPLVARGIAKKLNSQSLSNGLIVYLKGKDEGGEFSFAVTGINLSTLAMLGTSADDLAHIMASLNLDTEEYDKLNYV
jgi:hypothetical protein